MVLSLTSALLRQLPAHPLCSPSLRSVALLVHSTVPSHTQL